VLGLRAERQPPHGAGLPRERDDHRGVRGEAPAAAGAPPIASGSCQPPLPA
jgi:hypothetical protein